MGIQLSFSNLSVCLCAPLQLAHSKPVADHPKKAHTGATRALFWRAFVQASCLASAPLFRTPCLRSLPRPSLRALLQLRLRLLSRLRLRLRLRLLSTAGGTGLNQLVGLLQMGGPRRVGLRKGNPQSHRVALRWPPVRARSLASHCVVGSHRAQTR